MEPLTDVREISRIAYGLIASKALFAALNLDVFGVLSGDGKTCADTASAAGIAESRMATLLAALIGAGLVQQDGETFKNATTPSAVAPPPVSRPWRHRLCRGCARQRIPKIRPWQTGRGGRRQGRSQPQEQSLIRFRSRRSPCVVA